eukprot:c8031_g1_i1.p1 GENE.c8031_g1_i1~~c8031_g1_i1.p1  ORF type:complete len:413 (-),score=104.44 c8031_g1_i1:228-1409(-)
MADDDVVQNQPIVIDWGSGSIKAGIAGETEPKAVFPSFVGRKKHQQTLSEAALFRGVGRGAGVQRTRKETDLLVGTQAMQMRGILKLEYLMDHGIITNWDDTKELFAHIFSSQLKVNAEEHPILFSEAIHTPVKQRQKIAEILFERFHVPALCFSLQSVLALYASRKTSGLVLDCGEGITQTVPVYEGFPILDAANRSNIAGRDVTNYLQLLLRKGGYSFHTSAESEIVREIKEKACYVSKNPTKEEESWQLGDDGMYEYTLPDENKVRLRAERFRAPEILFRPSILGTEYQGVHEMVLSSVAQSDMEMRKMLLSDINLCGGTTKMLGFGERLMAEVGRRSPRDTKVRVYCAPERHKATWIGGSILASLVTFKDMVTTRKEYEEEGAANRRMF